jgi:uncharacterized protein (DUF1697 family)
MTVSRIALLLRGINVGRAKRIAMTDLAAMVGHLGGTEVRTLLNSGNVVCSSRTTPAALAAELTGVIEQRLGFHVDVVARTRAEIASVIAHDPLADIASDPSRHLVVFLDRAPGAADRDRLDALDLGGDRWVLEGRELYTWLPAGVAESPLVTQLAKGVLGVTWTGRNWTTVTKLHALL